MFVSTNKMEFGANKFMKIWKRPLFYQKIVSQSLRSFHANKFPSVSSSTAVISIGIYNNGTPSVSGTNLPPGDP